MHNRALCLLVVCLVSLIGAASASAAPTVTVRVEGETTTLLEETTVTLDGTPAPVNNCAGNTAAAALERATSGNWDRSPFVSTILGESHTYARSDYYAQWVNTRFGAGLCNDVMQEGDRLVLFVQFDDASFTGTIPLLTLTGVPKTVAPGAAFTVNVTGYAPPPGGSAVEGTPSPAAGAVITGGGASTGADGKATVALTQRGPATLKAVLTGATGTARSAAAGTCVTDGADGFCGTTKAGDAPAPMTLPAPTCQTNGSDGFCGTTDKTAPVATITGVKEQARFRRGNAPTTLSGRVAADPAGLKDVRLRLTRRLGPRCSFYDGERERFVKTRLCGARGESRFFSIGDRADWSYLMPFDLPAGRYVLDVQTVDKAGNVSKISARGRDRIVFTVK